MISEQMEQRIYQCLDGELSESEKELLFHELEKDPEALKVYCRCAALDANLQRLAHSQLHLDDDTGNIAVLKKSPNTVGTKKPKVVATLALVASVAAIITILGLLAPQLWQAQDHTPLVSFDPTPDTQYTLVHDGETDLLEETCLQAGSQLKLSQGTIELTFKSGVRSIITAPADLVLDDGNTLILNTGTAWFQVPERAIGFTVRTEGLDIVDLGTEFGVIAKLDGHHEVHVFKGEVKASRPGAQKQSVKLGAGQARRSDSTGQLVVIKPSSKSFITKRPTSLAATGKPLNINKGTQVTGEEGIGYTLSKNKVSTDDLKDGEFTINSGGKLALTFNEPVDLKISTADIPYNSAPWNSNEDFGKFTIVEGELSEVYDPNQEILIEPLSETSFKWTFTKPNDDKYRTPSMQSCRIDLKGIRKLELSKDASSPGQAAFKFQVISSNRK